MLRINQIKAAFQKAKDRGISIRHRFVLYIISLLCVISLSSSIVAMWLGFINPAANDVVRMVNQQLDNSYTSINRQAGELAALGIRFSESITEIIEAVLLENQTEFSGLKNNIELINEIERRAYSSVYTNMLLAPCSGAMFYLNTTINDSLQNQYFSGLYLKFANIYAENTYNNEIVCYRGNAIIARENGIALHSSWHPEHILTTIHDEDYILGEKMDSLTGRYKLTRVYTLDETWENVCFAIVPILLDGEVVGICGFEISELYFRLANPTASAEEEYMLFALITESEEASTAITAGSKSGYVYMLSGDVSIDHGDYLDKITARSGEFYGKTREFTFGRRSHTLAVVLPEQRYHQLVFAARFRVGILLLIMLIISIIGCAIFSRRFTKPLTDSIEQFKTNPHTEGKATVQEIDGLFSFYRDKDMEHEQEIKRLSNENKQELDKMTREKQVQIDRLSEGRKRELDPECYELFKNGVKQLTRTQHEIFLLYLDGKKPKEVAEIRGIAMNTLKYHNREIYGKLGVSSLKELLMFAELMKNEEQK